MTTPAENAMRKLYNALRELTDSGIIDLSEDFTDADSIREALAFAEVPMVDAFGPGAVK